MFTGLKACKSKACRPFVLTLAICTSGLFSNWAAAQTEVLTVQGNLPRLNYRDTQGNLLWAMPANNVLWKLDGPINAGVIVTTAAAPTSSIVLNEGGVSIRGGGFPDAKLHVGTIFSATEPGEVTIDPGNPSATATIHAVNANTKTQLYLETFSPAHGTSIRMATTKADFSHTLGSSYLIRDNDNGVIPMIIFPSNKNISSIVIKEGNIGLGLNNPTSPLVLKNGARCTIGGVWTNASSRKLKDNIEELSLEDAKETLSKLQPVLYEYKAEPNEQHAGFIAEEVPDLVATNERRDLSPMDFVAVLTKVVQEQEHVIAEQQAVLKEQAELIAKHSKLLEALTSQAATKQ